MKTCPPLKVAFVESLGTIVAVDDHHADRVATAPTGLGDRFLDEASAQAQSAKTRQYRHTLDNRRSLGVQEDRIGRAPEGIVTVLELGNCIPIPAQTCGYGRESLQIQKAAIARFESGIEDRRRRRRLTVNFEDDEVFDIAPIGRSLGKDCF